MKNKIIYFLSVPIGLIFLSFIVIKRDEPKPINKKADYSCKIELSKKNYAEGESIWLNISITNLSGRKDSIAYLTLDEMLKFVDLKNSKNEQAKYLGIEVDYIRTPYCVFEPGETKKTIMELNSNLGYNFASETKHYFEYLPADIYNIKLRFFGNAEIKFESEELTFSISNLYSDVFNRLKTFKSYLYQFGSNEDKNLINLFNKEIKRNENTVYEQEFLILLLRLTQFGPGSNSELYDSLLKSIDDSINKYPDSDSNAELLSHYASIANYLIKKPEKFENFKSKLNRNTLTSKMKFFLDIIEKKPNIIN